MTKKKWNKTPLGWALEDYKDFNAPITYSFTIDNTASVLAKKRITDITWNTDHWAPWTDWMYSTLWPGDIKTLKVTKKEDIKFE